MKLHESSVFSEGKSYDTESNIDLKWQDGHQPHDIYKLPAYYERYQLPHSAMKDGVFKRWVSHKPQD